MPAHPAGELYFIALVPPEPVVSEAWKVKEYMASRYGTKAALKSPPHITLHMPFRMKENKVELLTEGLTGGLSDMPAFDVELDGFSAFEPRVIYINVAVSESIQALYRRIRKLMREILHADNADWKSRGFTPHLTVAFRDLKKPAFREAWEEFKEKPFKATWEARQVCLLKHNGKRWEVYREFDLVRR